MPFDNDESDHGLLGVVFNWLRKPFKTDGSALNWVLFMGLLLVAAWFWQHTLISILDE